MDHRIRPHDPLPIGGVQMDGGPAEGVAPLHHRGIVVRMGDRDGGDAAETSHDLNRGFIDEGDAVPEDVADRRAQQQRALADGKLRHRADADQAGLVLPVAIEMAARERIERRPFLSAGRDELTLVLADRTPRRRLIRWRELAAAGLAQEGGHGVLRSQGFDVMPFVPRQAAGRNASTHSIPRPRCDLSTARRPARW